MKLSPGDFEAVFGHLSGYVIQRILDYKFEHRYISEEEYDKAILDMIKAVYHDDLPVSGPARHAIWEKGWGENLKSFDPSKAGRELAKPRYYNKYPICRWNNNLYMPQSPDYEHNMLATIQDWVFDKYLRKVSNVYEFGCGTGHNLFRVRDVNPGALLIGLDWAESAVKFINLQSSAGAYGPGGACARQFDLFNPDPRLSAFDNSAFVTVASLEQTGNNWRPFFNFVMDKQPEIVIHIEPIEEVLDDRYLLDHLSLGYFKKRGYLTGWLKNLQLAESLGKATIIETKRTFIGSKFIEGYSVVVWTPRPVVMA